MADRDGSAACVPQPLGRPEDLACPSSSLRGSHRSRIWLVRALCLLGCLLAGLLVLGRCEFRPPPDTSLLTGEPCAPPCWYGIVPGESTQRDVLDVLQDSSKVRLGSISVTSRSESGVALTVVEWEDRDRRPNEVSLRDGKVLRIAIGLRPSMSPHWIERKLSRYRSLTLGEVVAKRGPPEWVSAWVDFGEFVSVVATLEYPSQGLSIVGRAEGADDLVPRGGGYVTMSPGIGVTGVDYYVPTTLEGALRDVYLLAPESVEALLTGSQQWPGFGGFVSVP